MVFIGPIIVGAYVDVLGFSEQRAAQVYSADMAGAALGGILVFFVLRMLNWRNIVRAGFLLFISGNLVSIAAESISTFVVIRLVAGTGAGMLISMTVVSIGLTRSPDRIYGLWGGCQFTLAALVVAVLPRLITTYGLTAPFLILAGLGIAIFWASYFFPNGGEAKAGGSPLAGTRHGTILGVIGLVGYFVFFLGQAAVWPFGERMGIAAGLAAADIGNAVAASLIGAIGGSLLAAAIGNAFGRIVPLLGTMAVSSVGALIIATEPSLVLFTIGLCIFNFSWNFCIPYLNAIIANLDQGGRLLAAAGIVLTASSSAGPAIGSLILVEGNGYAPLLWLLLLSLPLGFIVLYPAARARN